MNMAETSLVQIQKPAAVEPLPSGAPAALAAYVAGRVILVEDVAAAMTLVAMAVRVGQAPPADVRCWVALCLALRAPRDGHTCVFLDRVASVVADVDHEQGIHPEWPTTPEAWETLLDPAGPLVGAPGGRAPFIRDGSRLYLGRCLHEEEQIAERLGGHGRANVEILLGGPGTGKTTEVARRLIALFQANPNTRIALAAPTGKAAARMSEALQSRLHDPNAPDEVKHAPPEVRQTVEGTTPLTIHKLLGHRPRGTPRYQFNATKRLDYELVVVDEASMLSSSLMHHLLAAIGEQTKLLLVGDPNQLASVDAGTVLGDIAAAGKDGARLSGCTSTLTARHRFGPRISALADAILLGEPGMTRAFDVLEGRWTPSPDRAGEQSAKPDFVRWVQPGTQAARELETEVVEHARELKRLAEAGDLKTAVDFQKTLQVLCAHRSGRMGVTGWNTLVERRLGAAGGSPWYAGRPIMVTRNNRALGLNNGDVGLVVPVPREARMDAAFPTGKEPRRVPVSRLEDVDTVHALTIHKSQGSEYGHAIVVLPEKPSRILTRELLYTGVTRARDKVTVVGSREVIEAAIKTPIRRATGLAERLGGG
ncbi:MAG: exodeoxyribonuclease V subunit alpha [Pirellulales bacterium]